MRVLATLQATKQPALLGRLAPGEVGVEKGKLSWARAWKNLGQAWLGEGLTQFIHLCSLTPTSQADPGLLNARLFWLRPLHRLHLMPTTSCALHLPQGHLLRYPLGQYPHRVAESPASELCSLPVAPDMTMEGHGHTQSQENWASSLWA